MLEESLVVSLPILRDVFGAGLEIKVCALVTKAWKIKDISKEQLELLQSDKLSQKKDFCCLSVVQILSSFSYSCLYHKDTNVPKCTVGAVIMQ